MHSMTRLPLQVVLMDAGSVESVLALPYLPVWRKVLSPQRPPALLRQVVADVRAKAGSDLPPGAALCFRGARCLGGGVTVACMWCLAGQGSIYCTAPN